MKIKCSNCDGSGTVKMEENDMEGAMADNTCHKCNGTGEIEIKSINELIKEIHQNAVDKGFWTCSVCNGKQEIQEMINETTYHHIECPACKGSGKFRNDAECIALIHSELSEALEELRKGMSAEYTASYSNVGNNNRLDKPEGWAVELADCVIRIFDYVGAKGIEDFEGIIKRKMEYNKTRPWKHNKNF
jgi:RecJ-like exonuclease